MLAPDCGHIAHWRSICKGPVGRSPEKGESQPGSDTAFVKTGNLLANVEDTRADAPTPDRFRFCSVSGVCSVSTVRRIANCYTNAQDETLLVEKRGANPPRFEMRIAGRPGRVDKSRLLLWKIIDCRFWNRDVDKSDLAWFSL